LTPSFPETAAKEQLVNRQDLIAAVAKRAGLSRARATELVDLIFGDDGVIAGELRRGGKVQISGFGQFETRSRAARKGRNPATNEPITLKATTVPAFRPGKMLKEMVKGVTHKA
jgi:DNA-binding protein HU-beta